MQKKGISLIVLVITIIVMIILAASVVISMSNNGIIDKAGQAVTMTDEKQVQDLASLIWAEAYLHETRTDTIENVVKDKLEEQGVTDTNWDIQVSNTGVTVTSKLNGSTEDEYGYLSGTWKFNDVLNPTNTNISENIVYRANIGGTVEEYNKMDLAGFAGTFTVQYNVIEDDGEYGINSGEVYWDSWNGEESKTIIFTTKQQVSPEFYDWFIANATKVS